MSQSTFADLEYEGKKRKTRREKFLERMEGLILGKSWKSASDRSTLRLVVVGGPMSCRRCFGYTACSCSTT